MKKKIAIEFQGKEKKLERSAFNTTLKRSVPFGSYIPCGSTMISTKVMLNYNSNERERERHS